MSSERPVMIIDGLNLFMRHYAAHPGMSKNGDQVGGIIGFLNAIDRLCQKVGPSEIYVIWESFKYLAPLLLRIWNVC